MDTGGGTSHSGDFVVGRRRRIAEQHLKLNDDLMGVSTPAHQHISSN